ncbi:alpha/beta fold hydrolase [Arthrobacter sp. YN]|uniref:alpha/beta fold hydrolase n=1 Tax=Arthrobacter sp. YN TaxID=2020486 RepID=UPI000B5EC948|nr:alpha/beta fold hydrolase [Arthrobacter sp. YN]ASN20143.1 lysophospholipase [Arthrobacter sp. YN]
MFWVAGDVLKVDSGTFQRGPLFVDWQEPANVTGMPLVLIHGGGGQGTDWLTTPDERPGWASLFRQAGHTVYVVDRPGHGRSAAHPDVFGNPGQPASYEGAAYVFAGPGATADHSQWPWGRSPGDREFDQFVASGGYLLADWAESQDLDARRIVELLERVGPSVLVAHSAGACAAWLVAARRPELVLGIVAIEPAGPPFASVPGVGHLAWGLTAAPMDSFPPLPVEDLPRSRGGWTVPALAGLDVLVVSGEASLMAPAAASVTEFLVEIGAHAHHTALEDLGIHGNGHGLIFERNSAETIKPVLEWINRIDWKGNDHG